MSWKSVRRVTLSPCHLVTLSLLLLTTTANAAAPGDDLLRLVPEDVGFCFVVQDLRTHTQSFLASPFGKAWSESGAASSLTSGPEWKQLADVEKMLQTQLGVTWAQLRDDILGELVVLAYRPGPPGQPAQEQGLFLVRARDAKLLTGLIDRLNKVQKDSGELKKLEEREYAGQRYQHRVDDKGEGFYYQRDRVLVFGSQEAILRQAIDREKKTSAEEAPIARQLRLLGVDNRPAALWVNPRAFDAEMVHNAGLAKSPRTAFVSNFMRYWSAVDGIALSLSLEKDVQVELAIRARVEQLPPAGRRFLAELGKPTKLWSAFPEHALLAVGSRIDVPALFESLDEFLSAEDKQALGEGMKSGLGAVVGKDLAREVWPCIGPDWGLCVSAPPAESKEWFPRAVLAVAVRSGNSKTTPVDQALFTAVEFYARLALVAFNRKNSGQLALQTETRDSYKMTFVAGEGGLPPGLRPAFALVQGHMVLASTPEVLREFAGALAQATEPAPGRELPFLRMSLKHLRQYLRERLDPLADYLADANALPRSEVKAHLDNLLAGLQFVDRVEITHQSQPDQARVTLRIGLAYPLK